MSRGPGFLTGLVVGGALGIGLGLLLAPRSGQQTRRELVQWREANRTMSSSESPASELLDLGVALIQTVADRFNLAASTARQAMAEARERLTAEWDQKKSGL